VESSRNYFEIIQGSRSHASGGIGSILIMHGRLVKKEREEETKKKKKF